MGGVICRRLGAFDWGEETEARASALHGGSHGQIVQADPTGQSVVPSKVLEATAEALKKCIDIMQLQGGDGGFSDGRLPIECGVFWQVRASEA